MLYRALLAVHVVAAVLFVSNLFAASFWFLRAQRSRDSRVVAHTFRALMAADVSITPVSVIVLVASGIAVARLAGLPLLRTGWIAGSIAAFSASGLAFAAVLPMQRRLARWTTAAAEAGSFDWPRYRREARRWAALAHLSLGFALFALLLMILRPPLPGP